METSATLNSLDPTQDSSFAADSAVRQKVAGLLFDCLVGLDDSGRVLPRLATSWKHDPDFRRWEFVLRRGVKMHDGSRLSPKSVVMSLSAANGAWHVHLSGDDVVVESDSPMPQMLAELARPRYSIVGHASDGSLVGTGPFRIAEFQPGKRLLVKAFEDCWAGRSYLDAVEITFGRNHRDQALDMQLERADVIEVPADQVRRAAQDGERTVLTSPVDLVAILFSQKVQDPRLRDAISSTIDRASIYNILLQKQGEPAASLLPQWVSGYAFLYPTSRNEQRVQQLRAGLSPQTFTLAYDWSDPLAKAIADRIAVNTRDAGVTVQVFGENLSARQANADMRLVRVSLPSLEPSIALAAIALDLGHKDQAQQIAASDAPDATYAAERNLLRDFAIVPLVYIPQVHALSPRVRNWVVSRQGEWSLDDVSLALEKP